jgi:hypothetical protein
MPAADLEESSIMSSEIKTENAAPENRQTNS